MHDVFDGPNSLKSTLLEQVVHDKFVTPLHEKQL